MFIMLCAPCICVLGRFLFQLHRSKRRMFHAMLVEQGIALRFSTTRTVDVLSNTIVSIRRDSKPGAI